MNINLRGRRWILATTIVLLASCMDRPAPTASVVAGAVHLEVVASLSSQLSPSGASTAAVTAYYARTSGRVQLATTQVSLTVGASQQVSLTADIAACLADPTRLDAASYCPLVVAAVAKAADGSVIDSVVVGPVPAGGSAGSHPLDVTLEFASLSSANAALLAMGDTMVIAAAAGGSTGATFKSSDTTTATVSAAGVVIGKLPGAVTITTTRGQTVTGTRIQVTPSPKRSVSVGDFLTCALDATGAAWCNGRNDFGQTGTGVTTPAGANGFPTPGRVLGSFVFTEISAGPVAACGLTRDQDIYCWGSNTSGTLGTGTGANSTTPVKVAGTNKWKTVSMSSGSSSVCALNLAGQAWCWGSNANGILAVGDTAFRVLSPTPVVGGNTFATISTGLNHICGLTVTGTALCWGNASAGAIGNPAVTTTATTPTPVTGGLTFTQLSAGGLYTCGLVAGGVAYCWGIDRFGTVGRPLTPLSNGQFSVATTTTVPTIVQTSVRFKYLQANAGNLTFMKTTCGIALDNSAYCFGSNISGGLGNPAAQTVTCQGTATLSFACTSTPTQVAGQGPWVTIASGANTACALTTTHALYCWGDNSSGSVGDGTNTNRTSPVLVTAVRAP